MTQQSLATILPLENQSAQTLLDWLHSNKKSGVISIGNSDYTIAGPVHTERAENPFIIGLKVDGSEAWLEVPRQLVEAICSAQQSEVALADVPDAYRGLFFEAILAELLTKLELNSATKIAVQHVYDSATTIAARRIFSSRSQADYHIFGFEVQSLDETKYSLGLKIGTNALNNLCRLLAHNELAPRRDYSIDTNSVQCLYGTVNIKKDALASIAEGDCLLVDKTLLQASFITLLLPDGLKAAGTLQENKIRLTSELQETMESTFTQPGADEIQLSLKYGEPQISPTEAAELEVGALVDIRAPGSPVGIYTDKKLIAFGQIVEIDKRLAIIIDELAA